MTATLRKFGFSLLTASWMAAGSGCSESTNDGESTVVMPLSAPSTPPETPPGVAAPTPAIQAHPGEADAKATLPSDVFQPAAHPALAAAEAVKAPANAEETKEKEGAIVLDPVKFDQFLARIAANKRAKYTLVDVWATWCVPCKENFPHVVEMHRKYADKGLAVASLSFDDPSEAKQVAEAKRFLTEKKAVFTNFLLDEEQGVGNEKLNISAIPAVFLFGPDGKEVRRFTLDNPNQQFTYEDVEKTVVALLDGKALPPAPGDEKPKASK